MLVRPLVCIGDLCTPGDSEAADDVPYIDDDDDSEGGGIHTFLVSARIFLFVGPSIYD